MPAITDRSEVKEPLLKLGKLNHGTLSSKDIAQSRRFYEEVLGLDVVQTSAVSLMIRKGTDHLYAVVEIPTRHPMEVLHHNGFEVPTRADVDACYEKLLAVKDEWGIKLMAARLIHGDYSFFFCDMDENWWEIVAVDHGGYAGNFTEASMDLTGRHDLESFVESWTAERKLLHVHDLEVRQKVKRS